MGSTQLWIILGAVAMTALGIGIGVWLSGRGQKKKVKERADETIQNVHLEVKKKLTGEGVDEKVQQEILKSDAVKKEIEEISKEPDETVKLKKLADLTNKLMKGK